MHLLDSTADRHISRLLAARGGVDPFLTEWVVSLARPGDTVLDLGGHVGYYTLLLARQVGTTGRVMAFEPDPANFALLAENVALNGYRHVDLFRLAVGDRTGPAYLHKSADNAGDHRVWSLPTEPRPAVPVQMVALDELFGPTGPRINLIKMDVQGAEPAAIRGMARLLARQSHLVLLTEFWPYGLAGAGADPAAFLADLAGRGFRLHVIDEGRRQVRAIGPGDALGQVGTGPDDFLDLLCIKA